MSWLAVEKALIRSVNDLALGLPIVQENDTTERKSNAGAAEIWLEVFNLPADTFPLDKNLTDQFNGIFQISIYGKQNKGKNAILTTLDTLLDAYKTGQQYTVDTCVIEIDSASPEPAREDGSYFIIDLSITWFAYIDR